MKKYLLLLSILLSIPLIFAGTDLGAGYYDTYAFCYQESANVSNQTGIDGSCTLNYTGTYNTLAGEIYINYTFPINSSYQNSLWQVSIGNQQIENLSTNNCNNNSNKLLFKLGVGLSDSYAYCYNGTDWDLLKYEGAIGGTVTVFPSDSYVFDGNWSTSATYYGGTWNHAIVGDRSRRLFEEAMYWNISYENSNLVENSQTFNSNTYGQSLETYSINLTYNSEDYPVITAILNYNNTEYTTTKTGSGSNAIFTSSVQLPAVSSQVNNTFYWTISITNTTDTYEYNSTVNYQLVNPISLAVCNSTINITALNFTAYSEKTLERLFNVTFKGVIEYWIGSSSDYKTYEFSNLSTNQLDICISNHVNYTTKISLQASLTDYNPTEYNLINYQINNVTQHLNLYLLNISSTTPFIIKIQGQNQLPLEDYYVYIYRYEPSSITPNLVQAVKTDSLGQTIGFFETYTVDYKFLVYDDDGNLVYTSEKMKIIPTTTPYTLTFTVGTILPSPTEYFDNLTGMTWTLGYNKNSYLASLSYSDSNSSFVYGNFIVKGLNMSGGDKVICNLTSSNPSAVLVCDLTGNLSGGYVAEFYVNRNNQLVYVDSLVFSIKTISQIVGMLGVLGAFFIILFSSFAFFTNEIAGILSVNFAVFMCEVFGLINIGLVGMSAIIGISILIIVVLVRNQ